MSNGLALSGVLSGMGQGIERGLGVWQSIVGQRMLLKEREESDMAREQRGYEHADKLEAGRQQHAEGVLAATQKFQGEQTDKTIKANAEQHEKTRGLTREIEGWKTQVEEGKAEDTRAHNKELVDLKKGEQESQGKLREAQGEYYKAYKDYLKTGKGSTGSGSPARIDLDTRKAAAQFYSNRIAPLEKQAADSLTSPEDRAALNKRIEALSKKGLEVLGIVDDSGPEVTLDNIGDLDPNRPAHPQLFGPGSTENQLKTNAPPAEKPQKPNLPIMGRNPDEPTLDDILKYQHDYETATRTTGKVSAVVDAFRSRWGRSPTEEEFRAANLSRKKHNGVLER